MQENEEVKINVFENINQKIKKAFGKRDIPLVLIFAVMLISIAIKLFFKYGELKSGNTFVYLCVVQLLIYIVPCFVYFIFKKDCNMKSFKFKSFSSWYISLIVVSSVLMFFTVLVLKYTSVYFLSLHDSVVKDYFSVNNTAAVILVGVILPMICEEILLRGLLQSELKKVTGAVSAIIISSILFGLIHFSLSNLLVYIGAGLILGTVTYVTDSIIPAIILHGVNNVTAIFTESAVISYANENVGGMFAFVFLLVIFLIAVIFWLYMLEKIYLKKSLSEKTDTENITGEKTSFLRMIVSPVFLASILIFILAELFKI